MQSVLVFIAVLCFGLSSVHALDSKLCQETPKEKHCLIEYMVRDKWPHQVRYVYNWYTHTCFEIRWSNHCDPVPSPTTSNNFETQQQCVSECGGWA